MKQPADQVRSHKPPVRILIVNGHATTRAGLATQVSDEPDLEVCGQIEHPKDAIAVPISDTSSLQQACRYVFAGNMGKF